MIILTTLGHTGYDKVIIVEQSENYNYCNQLSNTKEIKIVLD